VILSIAFIQIIIAMTAAEWAVILAAIIGAGGLSSVFTGWTALRREGRESRDAERTVAAEEVESALRAQGEAITHLQQEVQSLRDWKQAHIRICPIYVGPGGLVDERRPFN
jgi:hypothetical protein